MSAPLQLDTQQGIVSD